LTPALACFRLAGSVVGGPSNQTKFASKSVFIGVHPWLQSVFKPPFPGRRKFGFDLAEISA